MDILPIIGLGIIVALLCIVLRQARPEFALLVSLAGGLFILFALLGRMEPVLEEVNSMLESVAMPTEYAGVLLRALGICFLTQIACDTCKDAGESAISAKIEIAGKFAVLVVSLPLFRQVLMVVSSLLQ